MHTRVVLRQSSGPAGEDQGRQVRHRAELAGQRERRARAESDLRQRLQAPPDGGARRARVPGRLPRRRHGERRGQPLQRDRRRRGAAQRRRVHAAPEAVGRLLRAGQGAPRVRAEEGRRGAVGGGGGAGRRGPRDARRAPRAPGHRDPPGGRAPPPGPVERGAAERRPVAGGRRRLARAPGPRRGRRHVPHRRLQLLAEAPGAAPRARRAPVPDPPDEAARGPRLGQGGPELRAGARPPGPGAGPRVRQPARARPRPRGAEDRLEPRHLAGAGDPQVRAPARRRARRRLDVGAPRPRRPRRARRRAVHARGDGRRRVRLLQGPQARGAPRQDAPRHIDEARA
mmetsp:Transcript_15317/g.49966  ORF Transcript_15317/g.49966 Transcript_15317/m.49966 type:complete len:342 (+) Transcript_15317:145-1170(+)